jgi:hypothetical protein
VKRHLYLLLGWLFVGIGVVGAFVPLLPTTPFLLLAAGCWARSSPALRAKLLATPGFGPAIVEWEETRTVPFRAKLCAISMITGSCLLSVGFLVPTLAGKVTLVAIALTTSIWLWRIPTRDGVPVRISTANSGASLN